MQWVPSFLFALAWSVLVLSVGAISLLYWLLRHGAAANVARLFYLVPPITALMAWLLFGETLDLLALVGMALICAGVVLARRNALISRRKHDARARDAIVQELALAIDERPQPVERDEPRRVRAVSGVRQRASTRRATCAGPIHAAR